MNRKQILNKAEKMINGPRAKDYGMPTRITNA